MVILLILNLSEDFPGAATIIVICEQVLIYVSLLLTIISLIDYLVKNRKVLSEGNKK